jgi:hypothetical protein
VVTWEDSYAYGKSMTVWVLDMVGRCVRVFNCWLCARTHMFTFFLVCAHKSTHLRRSFVQVSVCHVCVCRKHPIHTTTDDDVIGLRQKIMKMPWIKAAEVFFLKDRQRVRGKSKNVQATGSYLINTSLNPAIR